MGNIFKKKPIVDHLADRIGCEKGKTMLVVGAGGTLRENADAVKKFIQKENAVTIGINKMTEFCVPNYHLWTNQQRYRDFGQCISPDSKLIFGQKMPVKLIRKHHSGDYTIVKYKKSDDDVVNFENGVIYGDFRTAGCLAIMIAHLFEAKNIYIVGMDGYTLHDRQLIDSSSKNQHCYGSGHTDDVQWEEDLEKDELVYQNLRALAYYGIKFKILTPTKFADFHDGTRLD